MRDRSLFALGGACSVLVGISYIIVGLTYVLLPPTQRPPIADYSRFLASVGQNPTPLMAQYWAFALGAVLAIAAVPAISEKVRSVNEGWVRWTGNLAFLGFAVTAIDFFRQIATLPHRVAGLLAGGTSATLEITRGPLTGLDPDGWLGFGGVGLWILVVSVLALRGGALPRPLAYLGVAVTVLYWLVVAGLVWDIETLILIAATVGGIVAAPIWYIWTGLVLRGSQ